MLTTKLGFTEGLQTSLKYRPKQRTDQSLCRSKNLKKGEEMRNYIFEFEQEQALKLDLNLKDLLLLDYMYKFFNSDQIKKQRKDEKFYCRLTYNKVLSDLPILHIKERQLRNMIIKLERKGILERFSELKNHEINSVAPTTFLAFRLIPSITKESSAGILLS